MTRHSPSPRIDDLLLDPTFTLGAERPSIATVLQHREVDVAEVLGHRSPPPPRPAFYIPATPTTASGGQHSPEAESSLAVSGHKQGER